MAVDMFIKIGDITGESVDSVHAGKIDVLAWSWGASNSGTTHMGGGGGSGKVSVQDLSFTKYVDSSSNALLACVCDGKHHPEANLIVRKAGGSPIEYIKIKMEEVMITSVSTGGSGGEDRLTETVTLNFAKFMFQYQPQKQDGSADGGTKDAGWDIAGNIKA
jgi:type VI secretion system secreted protein Hcp